MRLPNTSIKLLCILGMLIGLLSVSVLLQIGSHGTPYAYAENGGGIGSFFEGCNFGDPGKNDIVCVIKNGTNDLVKIVEALIIVIVVISGIMYIVSTGNPNQTALAKKTLVGAIIGLIIVVLSYSMVAIIVNLLS